MKKGPNGESATASVRIYPSSHKVLQQLSKDKPSIAHVVHEALLFYKKQKK